MTIQHSSRANIYFLEHCRVLVKDGVPAYLSEDGSCLNIPAANTSVLVLGTGTSITNAAVRMLSASGVLIGFCGSDCTPVFSGEEVDWFCPQNEYRPTEWSQKWFAIWSDEKRRLEAAKRFQEARLDLVKNEWSRIQALAGPWLDRLVIGGLSQFRRCSSTAQMLSVEADLTKKLYAMAARAYGPESFTRDHDGDDTVNRFLNHGNYLAYGTAACVLWVLGIPHSLAVMHGKTRRGALVFDVADIVKDAVILPLAFAEAAKGTAGREFRKTCTDALVGKKAMEYMFRTVETIAEELG